MTNTIPPAADRRCHPLAFLLTPGQAGDSPQFVPVLMRASGVRRPRVAMGKK
ncbi:hypothetical protein [Halostreptopolyspora alba]|uniref:hypothetical protein n=1 Tax=Halostreptopolyspora alba TaxID=2487137 RepID=UPI003717B634